MTASTCSPQLSDQPAPERGGEKEEEESEEIETHTHTHTPQLYSTLLTERIIEHKPVEVALSAVSAMWQPGSVAPHNAP